MILQDLLAIAFLRPSAKRNKRTVTGLISPSNSNSQRGQDPPNCGACAEEGSRPGALHHLPPPTNRTHRTQPDLRQQTERRRDRQALDSLQGPARGVSPTPGEPNKAAKRKPQRRRDSTASVHVVPIDEAVNTHRLLLIRGEAGSGKSLLLKRIAWALVQEKRETREKQLKLAFTGLPLWIQILLPRQLHRGAYTNRRSGKPTPSGSLTSLPNSQSRSTGPTSTPPSSKNTCRIPTRSSCSTDSTKPPAATDASASANCSRRQPETFRCRIIVTTRPEAGLQLPSGGSYAFADLQELNDADIAPVRGGTGPRTSPRLTRKSSTAISKKLGPRSDLRKLARNPQMLTILAILSHGNRLRSIGAAAAPPDRQRPGVGPLPLRKKKRTISYSG